MISEERLIWEAYEGNQSEFAPIPDSYLVLFEITNESTADTVRSKCFTIPKTQLQTFIKYLKLLQQQGYYYDLDSVKNEKGYIQVTALLQDTPYIYHFHIVDSNVWDKIDKAYGITDQIVNPWSGNLKSHLELHVYGNDPGPSQLLPGIETGKLNFTRFETMLRKHPLRKPSKSEED